MGSVEPGTVVFLHGAGLDPRLFEPVMRLMAAPTIAPVRPPYDDPVGASTPAPNVMAQAIDVLERLDEWASSAGDIDGSVTIAGVSGGATIGLAAAIALAAGAEPTRPVAGFVVHEPLVGPLAPELHVVVGGAARVLDSDPTPAAVERFLGGLVGDSTWSGLPHSARAFAVRHHQTVRAEVAAFVAFEPSAAELAAVAADVTVTIGERSGPYRRAAADVVRSLVGSTTVTIPDAAHLAHVENPAGFGRAVTEARVGTETHR